MQKWVNYNEVFSLMVKHTSIRVMMLLVTKFCLELDQMNVKITFLYKNIEEAIYMEQPKNFKEGLHDEVCIHKRPIYGFK